MAITLADFNKIWASTSPLTPYSFSESNYKQGWNFIGSTPPARQMWDFLQKQNDEKMQYIVNDICVPVDIDETSASGDYYSYPVPTGKVFANFKTLGGKTIAWNQLEPNPTTSYTGSSSHAFYKGTTIVAGHKYYMCADISATGFLSVYTKQSGNNYQVLRVDYGDSKKILTSSYTGISTGDITQTDGNIWIYPSVACTNIQIVDLTLAFGSGNEPTTVAQYEAIISGVQPYNAGTLLSAGVSNVISKDSSNNVVATMPIPSAVQSLEGYGWSAGSVYNYIDFTRKKFVKRVGAVDLGSLSWSISADNIFYSPLPNDSASTETGGRQGICSKYNVLQINYADFLSTDKSCMYNNSQFSTTKRVAILDSSYNDTASFKTAMSGVMLYYELATPVETDISSILGAVGIACGNTLTFDYDDDYKLPVPVSMDLIDNKYGMMTAQDKAKLDVVYDYIQRVSGN